MSSDSAAQDLQGWNSTSDDNLAASHHGKDPIVDLTISDQDFSYTAPDLELFLEEKKHHLI